MGLPFPFSFIKHVYSVYRQLFEVFVLCKNDNHIEEILLISTSPHSLLLVQSNSSLVINIYIHVAFIIIPSKQYQLFKIQEK